MDCIGWKGEDFGSFGITEWRESDVTIESLSEFRQKFDLIVHCAGSGSVGYSLAHPKEDFDKTVNTTLAVLEYMRLQNQGASLVYPSSAAVYGLKDDRPIREDEPLHPLSPYGYHKKITEELCESYCRHYGLKVSIIRFFSIYGDGLKKQLLWEACEKFSGSDGEAAFFGTGEETRDFLHVQDAVGLIAKASAEAGSFDIINGGSGQRHTVQEVLELMAKEFGGSKPVVFTGEVREGDPKYYLADTARAESLGWKPQRDLKNGVKEYVRWFKEAGAVR
jgi:UDP-glucose 4-epimerase